MLQEIEVSKLILSEKNPRYISKEKFDKLCESLKHDPAFVKARPVLVNLINDKYIVYAGHQRIRAAKKMKWKTIHCDVEENLHELIVSERTIKDNAHYGAWDFDLLSDVFDIDMLIECGLDEKLLIGKDDVDIESLNIEDVESELEEKEKKKKECPNCGHSF